jgi:hypothetical protein
LYSISMLNTQKKYTFSYKTFLLCQLRQLACRHYFASCIILFIMIGDNTWLPSLWKYVFVKFKLQKTSSFKCLSVWPNSVSSSYFWSLQLCHLHLTNKPQIKKKSCHWKCRSKLKHFWSWYLHFYLQSKVNNSASH